MFIAAPRFDLAAQPKQLGCVVVFANLIGLVETLSYCLRGFVELTRSQESFAQQSKEAGLVDFLVFEFSHTSCIKPVPSGAPSTSAIAQPRKKWAIFAQVNPFSCANGNSSSVSRKMTSLSSRNANRMHPSPSQAASRYADCLRTMASASRNKLRASSSFPNVHGPCEIDHSHARKIATNLIRLCFVFEGALKIQSSGRQLAARRGSSP